MAGYQFFHIETYARIPSKNHKKQSAKGIAKEAERYPEASLHVKNPQPYKLMFGSTPMEAVDLAEKRADKAKDKIGRKLRKDAQILLGGVVSYPVPMAELNPNDEALKQWLNLNYKFLRKKYGKTLKSIIAHVDESFFHLHFYVVPDVDNDGKMNIGQVHDGVLARSMVGGKQAKEKMRAYKEAMRTLQDDYYESVGKPCGLTREGANKRRLSRSEWKVEQAAAERLAASLQTIDEIESSKKELGLKGKELIRERAIILEKEKYLFTLKEKADSTLEEVKKEKLSFIQLRSNKQNVVKYLKSKVDKAREQIGKFIAQVSSLKNEIIALNKEITALVRVNEKLTYQNELRAAALKRDRNEMFELVNLVATGNTSEVIEKYNNNNKEYTL